MKQILVALSTLLGAGYSMPAYPYPFTTTQADGRGITLQGFKDENGAILADKSTNSLCPGCPVVQTAPAQFMFAQAVTTNLGLDLLSTGVPMGQGDPSALSKQRALSVPHTSPQEDDIFKTPLRVHKQSITFTDQGLNQGRARPQSVHILTNNTPQEQENIMQSSQPIEKSSPSKQPNAQPAQMFVTVNDTYTAPSTTLHADFVVNGKSYSTLQVLGRGGSSVVYRVVSVNRSDTLIYALKVVRLDGVKQAAMDLFIAEIELLKRLKGKNRIIQLFDSEVTDSNIFIVLECGELDLARMLRKHKGRRLANENDLRFYWQQMLEAVQTIHEQRIIHRDLKPENFLFVEGRLKLSDFGIARAIQNNDTSIYHGPKNFAGTLTYTSPEALHSSRALGAKTVKLGLASDIWSLGCILYEMVYGYTPFKHIPQMGPKTQAIVNPKVEIKFAPLANEALLDVLQQCLQRKPTKRPSIKKLLKHAFLSPAPLQERVKEPTTDEEMQRVLENYLVANGKTPRTIAHFSKSFFDNVKQGTLPHNDTPPTPLRP